jgi:hypothetical protein
MRYDVLQDIVQNLIANMDNAKDASFAQRASLQLEDALQQLYLSAVDKLAAHLGAKLIALMEVCSLFCCVCVCVCVCVYESPCVPMCVCVCVCIYIYIYIYI